MKTSAQQLLAPYATYISSSLDANDGRVTADVALLRAQAAHVAAVRNEYNKPADAWKNMLPLEDSTPMGNFFKACRTGSFDALKENGGYRGIYATLMDSRNVYADGKQSLSTDELIQHVKVESYLY